MSNPYESQKLLDEYLLFHYGTLEEIAAPLAIPEVALHFPVRSAALVPGGGADALDLGCSVGRSTFELSKRFRRVLGIDSSSAFIAAAEEIRTRGAREYHRLDEAHRRTPLAATLPAGAAPEHTAFQSGDAMDLPADLGPFDAVHAANLICRLADPARLLSRLPGLIRPGGHLVLTTPCTWLGEFTPPERWPDIPTLGWLSAQLDPAFALQESRDLPFLIRETARKFQFALAQASIWLRH
ncbi:hypothetical protein BH23VER1_BH23VER1_29730 [soil metagenome]